MCRQGEIEFAKQNFKKIKYSEYKEKLLEEMCHQGEIEFVKRNFKKIDSIKYRDKLLIEICRQGDAEFARQNFKEGKDTLYKGRLLEEMCRQGEVEFAKQNFEIIDRYDRGELLSQLLSQGEIEFAKQNFIRISTSDGREKLLEEMCRQGEIEFAKQNFEEVLTSDGREKLLEEMCRHGEIEFIKKNYGKIRYINDRGKLLEEMCRQGEIEFVAKNYKEILRGFSSYIEGIEKTILHSIKESHLQGEGKNIVQSFEKMEFSMKRMALAEILLSREKENQIQDETLDRMLISYLDSEMNEKETHGKKEVSSSGSLLYTVLSKSKIDKEMALKLIELGSGVNYTEYVNSNGTVTYTPTLYKAMQINDDEVRKEIVQAMVEAGADIKAEKVKIEYERYGKSSTKKREPCMDMNGGELRKYLKDREALTPTKSQDKTEKLNESYQQYGRDLKNVPSEKFEVKEKILDVCGATKESMSADSYAYASMFEEDLLYARLMFFKEQSIEIDPEKLEETMTLTAKQFADTYGEKVGINKNESAGVLEYRRDVNKKLKQQYPLPKSKEELRRKLEELTVKKEVE